LLLRWTLEGSPPPAVILNFFAFCPVAGRLQPQHSVHNQFFSPITFGQPQQEVRLSWLFFLNFQSGLLRGPGAGAHLILACWRPKLVGKRWSSPPPRTAFLFWVHDAPSGPKNHGVRGAPFRNPLFPSPLRSFLPLSTASESSFERSQLTLSPSWVLWTRSFWKVAVYHRFSSLSFLMIRW